MGCPITWGGHKTVTAGCIQYETAIALQQCSSTAARIALDQLSLCHEAESYRFTISTTCSGYRKILGDRL